MTNLKINSDSERKLLDCERDKSFTILKCVADKMKLHAKFECALTTLHKVSDIFKCRIDFFSEDEIEVVKTLCKLEKILAN